MGLGRLPQAHGPGRRYSVARSNNEETRGVTIPFLLDLNPDPDPSLESKHLYRCYASALYRVSHPIIHEILSCVVLGVPLPCLGSS